MPLMTQEKVSIAGVGSRENRRSVGDYLGAETLHLMELAAAVMPSNNVNIPNGGGAEADWWLRRSPESPEAAFTPRNHVPPNCFPPRHPRDFASFSENARPGTGGSEDSGFNGPGMTDLESLMDSLWSEYNNNLERYRHERKENRVARRASFCGVSVSSAGAVCWRGLLPPRITDPSAEFSPKVFLGGLPWDITEEALLQSLRHYHPQRIEWPGREVGPSGAPKGFAYVTLDSERSVRSLLSACRRHHDHCYYTVHWRNGRSKEVQIVPWALSEAVWCVGCVRLSPSRSVFVGALHGMVAAEALAKIMDDLFGGVVYAGIDTDKNKYPIGSGRVTFNNVRSYLKAISAQYVEIHTDKFTKKVQVDPYLEDSMCSVCNLHQGPYFCRDPKCYRYYCRSCWALQHSNDDHKPLMRHSKSNGNRDSGLTNTALRQSPHSDQQSYNGANLSDCFSGASMSVPSQDSDLSSLQWNVQ